MSTYKTLKFNEQKKSRKGAYFKCKTCKRLFYATPSRIRQTEAKGFNIQFCSMKCYDKSGSKNPFFGKSHSKKSIKKMLSNPLRCYFKKGIKNPNFVRWAENRVTYKSIQKIKKYLIMKIGKCEECGFKDTRILTIHHMDKHRKNNKKENLKVLCPNCHSLSHVKDKRSYGIINDGNKLEDTSNWVIDYEKI